MVKGLGPRGKRLFESVKLRTWHDRDNRVRLELHTLSFIYAVRNRTPQGFPRSALATLVHRTAELNLGFSFAWDCDRWCLHRVNGHGPPQVYLLYLHAKRERPNLSIRAAEAVAIRRRLRGWTAERV